MKYNELLELYKKGELDDSQKAKVSEDIEKHEAISNYLIENDDMFAGDFEGTTTAEEENGASDFGNAIKSAVRKAFIKAGIITSCVVLAIVFFTIFALPKIVSCFYYNPSKELTFDTLGGPYTSQFELDYAAYSELMLPGKYRFQSIVNDLGYGNYDITLIQNVAYDHNPFINVSGRIEKNNLILYNPNIIEQPTGNAFAFDVAGVNKYTFTSNTAAAGAIEDNRDYIDSLYDGRTYKAFITLDTVMSYTDFEKWCEENDEYPEWLALCTKAEDGSYETGCIWGTKTINGSCGAQRFDEKKYPYLTPFSMHELDDKNGDIMKQHVISMLSYLHDQDKFDKLVELDRDYLKYREDNVKANGLYVYGYVIMTDKEALKATFEKEHVGYIYVDTDF